MYTLTNAELISVFIVNMRERRAGKKLWQKSAAKSTNAPILLPEFVGENGCLRFNMIVRLTAFCLNFGLSFVCLKRRNREVLSCSTTRLFTEKVFFRTWQNGIIARFCFCHRTRRILILLRENGRGLNEGFEKSFFFTLLLTMPCVPVFKLIDYICLQAYGMKIISKHANNA